MRGIKRRALLVGLGSLALAACGRRSGRDLTTDGELVVVASWEMIGIDPARTGYLFSRLEITESLLDVDEAGRPVPALAQSWTISTDQRTWRFMLRAGARFHDGTAVTPAAVAFVLNRARSQPGVFDYVPVASIDAEPDAVIVRLKSPSNLLSSVLAHYSASIYAPASFDAKGLAVKVIGSGPYAMSDLSNQGFALTLAPTWAGAAPAVTRARYVSASRPETRSLMAESGQADLVYDLDPAGLQRLRSRKALSIVSTMIPRTVQLNMNASHPFLADVRARRALSLAIDRDGIAAGIMRDPDTRADQLFSPIMKGWYDPSRTPLKSDSAEAARLLAELGWMAGPDGILVRKGERFRLRFLTYRDRPELPPIATAIQAQFRKLGIDTEIIVDNKSAVPAAHNDRSLQLALVARGYVNIADPTGTLSQDFMEQGGDWGATGWSDPRVVAAITELAAGAAPDRQLALQREVADILHAELPVIPVAWDALHAAAANRIRNVSLDYLERSYRISQVTWA